jgi:hypothetical protein
VDRLCRQPSPCAAVAQAVTCLQILMFNVIRLLPAVIQFEVWRKAGAAACVVCANSYSLLQCSLHLTVSEPSKCCLHCGGLHCAYIMTVQFHVQHKSLTARIAAVCIAVNCNSSTVSS